MLAAMIETASGARCPAHPDASAVGACRRCGTFVCDTCRTFYDYQPLCPSCYARCSHSLPSSPRARWSLILAVIALFVVVIPLGFPAVVMAQGELAAIAQGQAPAGGAGYARAAALLGWIANVLFLLLLGAMGLIAVIYVVYS